MGVFLILLFALLYMSIIALAVVIYVLQGLGLSAMLRSVGYKRPWFAWIPILNARALGDLADRYDNGKPSNDLGKKLMTLMIVVTALSLGFVFGYFFLAIIMIFGGYGTLSALMPLFIICVIAFYVALIVFTVIYTVNYYKAVWGIYRIFAPSASVGLLILSIFVTEAVPFVMFALRNKEPQNLRPSDDFYEGKLDLPPDNPYTYNWNEK